DGARWKDASIEFDREEPSQASKRGILRDARRVRLPGDVREPASRLGDKRLERELELLAQRGGIGIDEDDGVVDLELLGRARHPFDRQIAVLDEPRIRRRLPRRDDDMVIADREVAQEPILRNGVAGDEEEPVLLRRRLDHRVAHVVLDLRLPVERGNAKRVAPLAALIDAIEELDARSLDSRRRIEIHRADDLRVATVASRSLEDRPDDALRAVERHAPFDADREIHLDSRRNDELVDDEVDERTASTDSDRPNGHPLPFELAHRLLER